MTHPSLVRVGAVAGISAAAFALVALVGFTVVVGTGPIADAAASAAFVVPGAAALGSVALLAVALVGLYVRQAERSDTLGIVGFAVALIGTILAAGAQWTYVFVVPYIAAAVPDLVNESSGVLLAGFFLSYTVLSLGWVIFGIATLRARIFPRWMAVLLTVGALIAFLPLPSRSLILVVAVAVMGVRLLREPSGPGSGLPVRTVRDG